MKNYKVSKWFSLHGSIRDYDYHVDLSEMQEVYQILQNMIVNGVYFEPQDHVNIVYLRGEVLFNVPVVVENITYCVRGDGSVDHIILNLSCPNLAQYVN